MVLNSNLTLSLESNSFMNSIFEYQFSLFLLFLLFDLFYTKSYKKIKNQYSKTSKYLFHFILFHFILLHDIILTQKMILIQKTKVEAKHENFLDEKDIFQEKESSVVRFNWKKILLFFLPTISNCHFIL